MSANIFMVTHDSYAASFCDRVIVLKDGQIYGELRKTTTRREFMDELLDTIRMLGGDNDDENKWSAVLFWQLGYRQLLQSYFHSGCQQSGI